MKTKEIYFSPTRILIYILVALVVYAWHPNFIGGVSVYKLLFPLCFIWLLFTKKIKNIGTNLRRTCCCWLIITLWGVFSFSWSYHTGNEWSYISYNICWILIGLCFSIFSINECHRYLILKCFCVYAGVLGIAGLFTAFTGFYFNETHESYYYMRNFLNLYRPNSIFYNVNDHAVFMFFSIIVLFLATEKQNSIKSRIVGLILFCSNIILVDSRGVELALLVFFVLYFYKTKKIKIYYKISILGFIILFSLINLPLILNLGIFSDGISDAGRVNIILMCLSSLAHTYFLGVGPGNIAYVNEFYFPSAGTVAPHNFFLEIFCDYGFVGLISILVWYFGFFFHAYKKSKYNNNALIVWISLVSFLPISVVSSSLMGKSWVACYFGILTATLNVIPDFMLHQKIADRS